MHEDNQKSRRHRAVDNPLVNRTVMRKIITAVDPEHPPADFTPAKVLFFIGGGRASGKTTVNNYLFDLLEEQGVDSKYVGKLGSYAFADVLEKPLVQKARNRLNRYLEKNTAVDESASDKSSGKSSGLGGQLIDHAVDTILRQGSPAVIDNHMDNPAFVDRILAKAKEHGYETVMISPHIDAETYFAREEHRFQTTGRPYDFESGLSKHVGFAESLSHYENAFDATLLLDNDRHGQAPTPISYSIAGEVTVLDEDRYHAAQRKADINIHAKGAADVWSGQRHDRSADAHRPAAVGARTTAHPAAGAGEQQPVGAWSQRILEGYAARATGQGNQHGR